MRFTIIIFWWGKNNNCRCRKYWNVTKSKPYQLQFHRSPGFSCSKSGEFPQNHPKIQNHNMFFHLFILRWLSLSLLLLSGYSFTVIKYIYIILKFTGTIKSLTKYIYLFVSHHLNLLELPLPLLRLPGSPQSSLLKWFHARWGSIGLGLKHCLIAGVADVVAIGCLVHAPLKQLIAGKLETV